MSSIDKATGICSAVDHLVRQLTQMVRGMEEVSPEELGLDPRCGRVFIDRQDRAIAVVGSQGSRGINYYGAFEYIREGEGRTTIGEVVIYRDHPRVEWCFEHLLAMESELEEDTEAAE